MRSPFLLALALLAACDGPTRTVPDATVDGDPSPPPDAPISLDARISLDAQVPMDALAAQDTGSGEDGGLGDDASTSLDAEPVDAATSLDGGSSPFERVLPPETGMTTVTRLGDDTFIIASVRDTDASSPEGEELVLEAVRREGHSLRFEASTTFPETSMDPMTDNPIHLIEAMGPEHFFVVLLRPDGGLTLRLFARRSGTFVDLASIPLVGGADFGTAPSFLTGHPVDDTRYLLGYRERSSGEPKQYRLILRTGDSLRFGPAIRRPASSSFPGLARTESQIDPALLRVGPTTFVEARPGYVMAPGYNATWTLEVLPGNSLSATAPTVHSGSMLTMVPEVAADGRGRGLIAFHSYRTTDWHLGAYQHDIATLTDRGVLGTSEPTAIRGHQGESTDRYLGGSYYLRLPGDTGAPAPLYRVDASDFTVEHLGEVPGLFNCYRVPQMVRAGTIAAYTGCDRIRFVDLLPLCGNRATDPRESCDDGNNTDGDGCSAGCEMERP